jgi:serine/threonine-protein kinase
MSDGLLIGGKYRLEKLIGSGGMGQVWVARHEVTGRPFAIKLLQPQAASEPQFVTRLVQEAKFSAMLRHPGIIEIYDVGTAPERSNAPFLVMELLHGISLQTAIRPGKPLPVRFALLVAIAVTRALKAAHDKAVIHRDLKPANVFLHRTDSGAIVPKLLDFGISKLAAGDADPMALTHSGMLLGSPRYMSPEQMANQKDIDGRSDLHALGVLLWCCLVGSPPFAVPEVGSLVLMILSEARPRLRDVRADVPPGVCDFVTRAFARQREARPANAAEALMMLEAELEKLGPGPTLESSAWIEEVLEAIELPTQSVPLAPFPTPMPLERETSAQRAVSVSVKPPEFAAAASASMGGSMQGASATASSSSGRFLLAGVAGILVTLAVVGGGLALYKRPAGRAQASGTVARAAASSVLVPAATTALAVEPSAAPASSAADGGGPTTTAPSTSPSKPTKSQPGSRPTKGPAPGPRSSPRGNPSENDPFGGVTGTGL